MYDVKRADTSLRQPVNRALHNLNAHRLQHSVWGSDLLEELLELTFEMVLNGGTAMVLEKRSLPIRPTEPIQRPWSRSGRTRT